ncbi:protein of unknown function, DUF624 [Anaerolinea thermolimosa]|nr:protein of unknown function, DUF624 [Anaerolinea thermolimosa]
MKLHLPAFLRVFGKSAVDWYDAWLDMTVMGILWLIAQVTIILGPPATFGVYYVVNLMIRTGENRGIKGMFEGAKKYFWQSLGWGALNLLVLVIAVVNFTFYSQVNSPFAFAAQVFVMVLTGLWLMTQFYTVPFFMAQQEERILLALRNGFFMAVGTLFFTVGLMILEILIIALCVFLILPAFLGVPLFIPVLGTRALYDRLEAFGLRKKDPDPREIQ